MPKVTKPEWDEETREFMRDFGENLHKLRENKGLSLREFEKVVGVSRSTIQGIEAGERVFLSDYFPRFAKALGVPISALMPADTPAPDT